MKARPIITMFLGGLIMVVRILADVIPNVIGLESLTPFVKNTILFASLVIIAGGIYDYWLNLKEKEEKRKEKREKRK